MFSSCFRFVKLIIASQLYKSTKKTIFFVLNLSTYQKARILAVYVVNIKLISLYTKYLVDIYCLICFYQTMTNEPLQKAIDIVGTQEAFGELIGQSQQTISYWLNKRKRVPAEFVITIVMALDGQITCNELRPDIYPE